MSDGSIVTYKTHSDAEVKLSPSIVRKYLVKGQGSVDDQEVTMFLMLCRNQRLDPFLGEAHLIKYGSYPAAIVTGKETFVKRAERNPQFKGFRAGIIVLKEDGAIDEREGCFYLPDESIVGGWAEVYKAERETPYRQTVAFSEYAGTKNDGTLNRQWAGKPATMIRKVALVQALREAFPEDFSGLYDHTEMAQQIGDVSIDDPVPPRPEKRVGPEVDASGKRVQPEKASAEELAPIVSALRQKLDDAMLDQIISSEEHEKHTKAIDRHIKAGSFEGFAESTMARLDKMRAELEQELSGDQEQAEEAKASPGQEQPDLIDDPPIF